MVEFEEHSDDGVAEEPTAPRVIADSVKQLILSGEVALGAPVTERWMTEQFHASRATVRDALNLLVAERYLDRAAYHSARVRSYSADEVRDIMEARLLLEGFAADRCDHACAEARAQLRRAFATYATHSVAGRVFETALAHVELHVSIVALTGNAELARAERGCMTGSMLLVDLINWKLRDSEKMYLEHAKIVHALLEPDPATARAHIEAHLSMVSKAVERQQLV